MYLTIPSPGRHGPLVDLLVVILKLYKRVALLMSTHSLGNYTLWFCDRENDNFRSRVLVIIFYFKMAIPCELYMLLYDNLL